MFYYLLYNSSFSFILENRLFSTVLYGSILYILTHAVLNYCELSILTIINNYYWTLLTLDIISFSYAIYNSFINNTYIVNNNSMNDSGEGNNMNVSFNLLKNKINTMLDRKNDLTVTRVSDTNYNQNNNNNQTYNLKDKNNKNQIQEHFKNTLTNNSCNNFIDTNKDTNTDPLDNLDFTDLEHIAPSSNELKTSTQFSTPINQLKKNSNVNHNINTSIPNNLSSTPISLIRTNVKIDEPIVNDYTTPINNNCNESNAGSDVGSVMDLEDFANSF